MTFSELKEIIARNQIPENVEIMTNSGWECGATPVEGIYYSPSKNEIHLVPIIDDSGDHGYDEDFLKGEAEKAHDWICIS